jgi:superfamily II DNA or RNA helicase
VHATLPPVFLVNIKENGNCIRQIGVPAWSGEVTCSAYQEGNKRGLHIQPITDATSVVLFTGTTTPPAELEYALRLRTASIDPAQSAPLDLSKATWLRHPITSANLVTLADYESYTETIRQSWRHAFAYKAESVDEGTAGLRPPQLGAIHGIQSHWTVSSEAGTVVLPTGVGKTETMIATLVAERCQRVLIVVPSDALRTQLADKFLTLGVLKESNFAVIASTAHYPVVGILNKRPTTTAEVDSLFRKCNVLVTTMPLASQCGVDVMERMAELTSCLFIDEAHHVAAPTWSKFRDAFAASKIVQFTATPFRNDNKPIGGQRLFTFGLRQAQEQGYFKEITFKPVVEFDPEKMDSAIADAAVAQLKEDIDRGHILMARVQDVARATEVFRCYEKYPQFNPVQLHTGIKGKAEREAIRAKLLSGESRIVICVDMLGEGFDLPELKIAAFHDIRKSLAVTLQLAGRFTRTKPHLGNATFIANIADLDVKDELRRLYQHDSDWNALLPVISDKATSDEFNLWEFLGGFQELPKEITLLNVRPAMSTVVYRTKCTNWSPLNFSDGIPGFHALDKVYHTLNPHRNTLVVVTTKRVSVDWAQIDEIHNWDWQLYVLHWSPEKGLLFIHNSSNAGFFKKLAKAVAGEEVARIEGAEVFRCLAGINRLKLQNVGLKEQLGRLIRYTMRAGSDVESGMTEAQKQKAIKSNLFGNGFENGGRTTLGCSYKGRIWSFKTTNLLQLTNWCEAVGGKLEDKTLNPEDVLNGTLVPVLVTELPEGMPIGIEWPDMFYQEPEQIFSFQISGHTIYLHDAEITLVDPSPRGRIVFSIGSLEFSAQCELTLYKTDGNPDFAIKQLHGGQDSIKIRSKEFALTEFLEEHLPTIWYADGSSLCGIEHVKLRHEPAPFPKDRIETWDWDGTDICVESQGHQRNSSSIQYRVIRELEKRDDLVVIFDDDDKGESADVVAICESEDHVIVEFWHCKYATDSQPGARIGELYELCGQAQKSIRWIEKQKDLFSHLMRREPRVRQGVEVTRFERGAKEDLLRIREKSEMQRVLLKIVLVQPGISKEQVSRAQLELMAVTENYLMETFAIPLRVVTSR